MRATDKRIIWGALAALLLLAGIGFGLSTRGAVKSEEAGATAELSAEQEERLQEACASPATYARLKEVAFEEAVRIRNSDPANLDRLAANSVVRMETPVVKSRDENLNVTVCTGRFVLELPPGAEAAFGGQRRIVADIEYAAQAAADGSGLVYQMSGAEPIIYRLAAFDLRRQPGRARGQAPIDLAQAPAAPEPAAAAPPPAAAEDAVLPQPAIESREAPATAQTRREEADREPAAARPSFNCRSARTRSERMVCSSSSLAALDREMSSLYYSAMADAGPRARRELRRTRDRFLGYRERCRTEACVADTYRARMREIRDIMAALD